MNRDASLKSILLVDDSRVALEVYAELLQGKTGAHIVPVQHPEFAIEVGLEHFFDIIMIDVSMQFKGTQLGGMEVYKSLKAKYGDSSFIVYSQVISPEVLKECGYGLSLLDTGENPVEFINRCVALANALREKQVCFVAMPFSKKYDEVFAAIKTSVLAASYRCVRIDERQFTRSIVGKTISEIENAKIIIFLATDQNPNAYYECGYSVALNKEVIILIDSFDKLPFDIRDRNAIAYETDYEMLLSTLTNKLRTLTEISGQ